MFCSKLSIQSSRLSKTAKPVGVEDEKSILFLKVSNLSRYHFFGLYEYRMSRPSTRQSAIPAVARMLNDTHTTHTTWLVDGTQRPADDGGLSNNFSCDVAVHASTSTSEGDLCSPCCALPCLHT